MLNVAICIDNVVELKYMSSVIADYIAARPDLPIRIRRFQSLYDLTDRIALGRVFHLCLLDHPHSMSWMHGLSAEFTLRRADPGISIIGFTTNEQAAFLEPFPEDSLGLEACLLKPTSTAQLYSVLDRVIGQRLAQLPPPAPSPALTVTVYKEKTKRSLLFSQLVRLHYSDHLITCCMADGEKVQTKPRIPFYQFVQPLMETGDFSWASDSCVVNLTFVEELDKNSSTMRTSDGEITPVPKVAFQGLEDQRRAAAVGPSPAP